MFEFLNSEQRKKTIRTTLYGDQEFSAWEIEVLHTPIVQRLYNLKQLGFADRVYPDAVHSRFNHLLGVAEMAERMAIRVRKWLHEKGSSKVRHAIDRLNEGDPKRVREVECEQLAQHVDRWLPAIRLMGLLHDITHAAFGHTLEDEVRVFAEKHDNPERQIRFFDALVAQLFYIWCVEARIRDVDPSTLESLAELASNAQGFEKWVEEIREILNPEQRKEMGERLYQLEFAFRLLLRLEFLHRSGAAQVPAPEELYVRKAIVSLCPEMAELDFTFHRDAFMIDLVGNTICADLLDYGRRDAVNAGLKVQFDERLIRYLTVVSVEDTLSPTREPCLRLAIQIFTNKMRHDVLSEMSAVLKARYVINERVLFHPTKCAAGGVLGSAAQLLGISRLPAWVQVLGDQEFLAEITRAAVYLVAFCDTFEPGEDYVLALNSIWGNAPRTAGFLVECIQGIRGGTDSHVLTQSELKEIKARAAAARRLCWNLAARRLPRLAFRLRTGVQHSGGESDESIAGRYVQPLNRFVLERRVEDQCNLPKGAVVVHCPRRRTSMKVAEVLVVGSDLGKVAQLRDATRVSPEGLEPYQAEIRAVEEMYRSIWQLHVFLERSWFDKQPIVAWALERELGFPNDELLKKQLADEPKSAFGTLAGDLRDEFAPAVLSHIVREVDKEPFLRMRYGKEKDVTARLRAIIGRVGRNPTGQQTLDLQRGLEN